MDKLIGEVGMRGKGRSCLAKTHEAIAKGRPVFFTMDSEGFLTVDISNAEGVIGVALDDIASGEVGEFCLEGVCYALVTADACVVGDGLLPDTSDKKFVSGGAFAGIIGQDACTDAGVAMEANAGVAALIKVYLHGYTVDAQA